MSDTSNNFTGSGDKNDRWNFFGNPADFKSGSSSIPYCTGFPADFFTTGGRDLWGVSCSQESGINGLVTNLPASLASACSVAPDINTLAGNATFSVPAGGCYVDGKSVMVPPALGHFGTMGRNIFRDNGFKNWDFSIFKTFTFKERYGAQFQVEVFNLLNHPTISNPNGANNGSHNGDDPPTTTSFGYACATPDFATGNPIIGSGSSRAMHLGYKLTF